MQTIDEEVAFELRNFKGQSLALDGLEHLTTEVAESLSLIKPTRGRLDVSLNRLTSISGEASAYISRITVTYHSMVFIQSVLLLLSPLVNFEA